MEFEVRGLPQIVGRVDKSDSVLHDPLLVTVLDFDRRALDQLAHGLHLTVIHTYDHAPAAGIDKNRFFEHRGSFVNPSEPESGGNDVYYLLKNIQDRVETYSKLLRQDKERIQTTATFLLDNIRNAMAHQSYLRDFPGLSDPNSTSSCVIDKTERTKECLDECAKMLKWVVDADFYQNISEEVKKVLQNIKNMRNPVFKDFQRVEQSMRSRQPNCTNTQKAKELLKNLLEELDYEEDLDDNIDDRPITHVINMVLAPRIKVTKDY